MMVRHCNRRSFWLRVLYVMLQSVLPLLNLYLLKLLIDAVTIAVTSGGEMPLGACHVQYYLLAMCGVFLINRVVTALNAVNNDVLGQRLIDYVSDLIQRQSARLDMQYYDNPSYHDTFHRAQQEATYRPLQILNNFMSLGGALLSIAGVVIMLAAASWWVIVVMIVAVLPGFGVRLYKARKIYRFRRENTQLYRRTTYYGALLSAREFAKEIRAFRLASLFRGRFVEARKQLVGRLLSISRRLGALDILCGLIETVAMFAVVSLLISEAYVGAITLGTFVMLFEAFRRGQGYLSSLVGGIAGLYDNRLSAPEEISEVELRDVTFRYPDMDRDVLSHFSLRARRGEITRIDGRNGFGKSTVIKLLLRLYDPQQGTVLVNGIDVRRFRPEELRSRMGVLFQDFVRYNLSVSDNIQPATQNETHDAKHLELNTSLRLAGAQSSVDSLPQKEATILGRLFDGGSELSMGQWQRIALARALATDSPVLLLDEPAAWLDADARHHLAETLITLQPQKIILLVTHSQNLDEKMDLK